MSGNILTKLVTNAIKGMEYRVAVRNFHKREWMNEDKFLKWEKIQELAPKKLTGKETKDAMRAVLAVGSITVLAAYNYINNATNEGTIVSEKGKSRE